VPPRGRARLPQERDQLPRLRADCPRGFWSWDISFLPDNGAEVLWLYLYLVRRCLRPQVVVWM